MGPVFVTATAATLMVLFTYHTWLEAMYSFSFCTWLVVRLTANRTTVVVRITVATSMIRFPTGAPSAVLLFNRRFRDGVLGCFNLSAPFLGCVFPW